jgi:hypothetical protein
MAELKTQRTDASVDDFLAGVADSQRRADARAACALMREVTGVAPVMWGTSIVGFGEYHYHARAGKVNDWPAVGLSPRKQSLTIYVSGGFAGYDDLLSRLGRHTTGRACLYLPRLSEVDDGVLREIVARGFAHLNGQTIN